MNIVDITNAKEDSGVGYRLRRLKYHLTELDCDISDVVLDGEKRELVRDGAVLKKIKPLPGVFGSKTAGWVRLGRYVPKLVVSRDVDVYNLSNQTLSFLAKKLSPTVITVHDLIELIEPQSGLGGIAARYLYMGIVRAGHVIAVSSYTKDSLLEHFDIPESRITVVRNGVGPEFHLIEHFSDTVGFQTLRSELKLDDAHPIVLYVGSEHPRKNVPMIMKAFAAFKKKNPDAVFVKVGAPGLAAGRAALLEEIDALGLRKSVRFIQNVSIEKLNELYNIADVFVYPSTFEGFGLPPLQAMAAGTPVVCSNAASLPEVVGSAGLMHHPNDVDGFADSMQKVVEDTDLASELQEKGFQRAQGFPWEKSANMVKKIYAHVIAHT